MSDLNREDIPFTLVLGHGAIYETENVKKSIQCSPIPIDDWLIKGTYISIDQDRKVRPHIQTAISGRYEELCYLFMDNSFDRIVDTCGMALKKFYKQGGFKREMLRLLRPGGTFYGDDGFTIHKVISKNPLPTPEQNKHYSMLRVFAEHGLIHDLSFRILRRADIQNEDIKNEIEARYATIMNKQMEQYSFEIKIHAK